MSVPSQSVIDTLLRGFENGEIEDGEIQMEEKKNETQYMLRPCPFCGGINLNVSYRQVSCRRCGAQGPCMCSEELAVAFWNKQVKWKSKKIVDSK